MISLPKENSNTNVSISRVESKMLTKSGAEQRTYGPLDKLEGGRGSVGKFTCLRNFYIDVPIKDFRPERFSLKIPTLIVNGDATDIAPVIFETHRGMIVYEQLQ